MDWQTPLNKPTFKYTFTGYIRPEYPLLSVTTLPPIEFHLLPTNVQLLDVVLRATAEIAIINSQVVVRVATDCEEFESIGDHMEIVVQAIVDSLGYVQGQAYIAHLTAASVERDGQVASTPFLVGVMAPEHIVSQPIDKFDASDLVNLLRHSPEDMGQIEQSAVLRSNQIRLALANVREAMHSPHNTALLCYRAIENLRQCYATFDMNGEEIDRKASWASMRESLRIEESFFDAIRIASVPQRHGLSKYMSGQERTEAVKRTRMVIDRFIVLVKNGHTQLPGDVEVLKGTSSLTTDNCT